MPLVTALIDDLRAAFGRADVDQVIRDGMRDGTFWAREGGREIGGPVEDDSARAVRLSAMFPYNERTR